MIFKRFTVLFLSFFVCFSAFSVPQNFVKAHKVTEINNVYTDDFSSDSLNNDWAYMADGKEVDGIEYTSEIANGQLKVNTHKHSRSATAGCLYLPKKQRVNQRVAVEFENLQKGDNVYV